MGIDETKAVVSGKLAEINIETTILLHKRNQDINEGVKTSNRKVQDLQEQVKSLRDDNDVLREHLQCLKEANDKFYREIRGQPTS